MTAIAFSILSVSACAFLIYVFVQFRRELLHVRTGSAGEPRLTRGDIYRIEAAWKLASMSYRGEGQRTKHEAVLRKEMLTAAICGLVGLFAPFIFVVLLNSNAWSR
jgi:hypothetical protein